MIKKTITARSAPAATPVDVWLDLESMASVEITSETADNPIDAALGPDRGDGWRAADPGKQLIRIVFDAPAKLGRVLLEFREEDRPRTQEFCLRYWQEGDQFPHEIVRQQYTFGPPGTVREIEDYRVPLSGVSVLELEINPDISNPDAYASLTQMRLA